MKEIGGYLELEHFHMPMLHEGALQLNCGRNCLAYLLRSRKISNIKLPLFLCDSVKNICIKYGIRATYYHINDMFFPTEVILEDDEWLYVVNYYGQLKNKDIKELAKKYKRIIVDNAQAYFEMPVDGVDSLYTCRKFFGVADGAFLYTNSFLTEFLSKDESFERMHFLLGRYERSASEFYNEYVNNNRLFIYEDIKLMSALTLNLLHSIDYEWIKEVRTANYVFLANCFEKFNELKLCQIEGAFAYPLMLEKAPLIRKKLIEKKIYIPLLWPNVLSETEENSLEYRLANNVLPIPCDQRYGIEDMKYIVESIRMYL